MFNNLGTLNKVWLRYHFPRWEQNLSICISKLSFSPFLSETLLLIIISHYNTKNFHFRDENQSHLFVKKRTYRVTGSQLQAIQQWCKLKVTDPRNTNIQYKRCTLYRSKVIGKVKLADGQTDRQKTDTARARQTDQLTDRQKTDWLTNRHRQTENNNHWLFYCKAQNKTKKILYAQPFKAMN